MIHTNLLKFDSVGCFQLYPERKITIIYFKLINIHEYPYYNKEIILKTSLVKHWHSFLILRKSYVIYLRNFYTFYNGNLAKIFIALDCENIVNNNISTTCAL